MESLKKIKAADELLIILRRTLALSGTKAARVLYLAIIIDGDPFTSTKKVDASIPRQYT